MKHHRPFVKILMNERTVVLVADRRTTAARAAMKSREIIRFGSRGARKNCWTMAEHAGRSDQSIQPCFSANPPMAERTVTICAAVRSGAASMRSSVISRFSSSGVSTS